MGSTAVTRGGLSSLLGGVAQVATGTLVSVDPGLTRRSSAFFRDSTPLFVLIGLLMLGAILALWVSGAAGPGRLGVVGLVLAVAGRVLFMAGEVVVRFSDSAGAAVLGAAEPLTAVGMILLGVAVLRHGLWTGVLRWAPLVVGIYIFVVLLPAFAISGGPNFAAVAGWGVCWAALGAALMRQPTTLKPVLSPS